MPRTHAFRPALLWLICAGAAGAQSTDQVILVPGSTVKSAGGRVRGQVIAETPAEVKVQLGANTQSIPVDQVESITYGNQPASYVLAETREAAGAASEAAELYKKAAGDADGKPFVVQAAKFHQARAVADQAMADPTRLAEAIGLVDAFAKGNAGGRHVGPALELLARLQLQKGSTDQAEQAAASLAKVPGFAPRAAVLRARAAAAKGDQAAAIGEFDAIIAAAPEGSPGRRDAQLARAEALAASKKYPEAEAALREVIRSSPAEDAAAQSAAYNALGDCLRAAGKNKDALYAYLHTDLLYSKDKGQHARALARIVPLWRELKRDDRADEVLERLRQEYPKSPYLQAASPR